MPRFLLPFGLPLLMLSLTLLGRLTLRRRMQGLVALQSLAAYARLDARFRTNSPLPRWMIRLAGVHDPDGKMPHDPRLTFVRQCQLLRAAVTRMVDWDPELGRGWASPARERSAVHFRWTWV